MAVQVYVIKFNHRGRPTFHFCRIRDKQIFNDKVKQINSSEKQITLGGAKRNSSKMVARDTIPIKTNSSTFPARGDTKQVPGNRYLDYSTSIFSVWLSK